MRNREKGFSLIELLIVVAIILIIAAIAIPNLLQSRQRANESSASGTLRTINTSEVTFQTTYGVGFAYSVTRLGGPVGVVATCDSAQLIDNVVGCAAPPCTKSGYLFDVAPATEGGAAPVPAGLAPVGTCATDGMADYAYQATAQNNQGRRGFYSGSSGVLRFCVADPATPCTATAADNALQ